MKVSGWSAVGGLLCWCCPLAVVFRVALRVVNALNPLAHWWFAHVQGELLKATPAKPLRADSDSPAAIVAPDVGFRV